MLTVYRPSVLPDARATGKRWRSEAAAMGLPGLYLVATKSFDFKDHRSIGFDALSEFPPHGAPQPLIRHSLRFVTPEHSGGVHAYLDFMRTETPSDDGTVLPGVMTGWDNSARIKGRAHIVHGSTPQLFRQWLDKSITRARRNPPDERLVLINAWNEWGEAAYLEPDRRFGYAYLAACGSAVADHGSIGSRGRRSPRGHPRSNSRARRRFGDCHPPLPRRHGRGHRVCAQRVRGDRCIHNRWQRTFHLRTLRRPSRSSQRRMSRK